MQVFGILGLGISGIGALHLLAPDVLNGDVRIIFWDDNENKREAALNLIKQLKLSKALYEFSQDFSGVEKLILSPGIDTKKEQVQLALQNGAQLYSDLDLFYHKLLNKHHLKQKIIGVTGTNGKSTTTALIHHILQTAKLKYSCAGNIGKSICLEPFNQQGYVIELSSYQIDLLQTIKIDIGVLLNITPDHLERYGTFNKYVASKRKILQLSHCLILCIDDINNYKIWQKYKKRKNRRHDLLAEKHHIIPISCHKQLHKSFYITDTTIYEPRGHASYSYSTQLIAKCNKQNILAAYVVARLLGLDTECILRAIYSFAGLEHRLEHVRCINTTTSSASNTYRITFYNDSKATNAQAAIESINSIHEPIYLLCGGIAKASGIEPLSRCSHKICKIYFFGQDAQKLMSQWRHITGEIAHNTIYHDLKSAVNRAYQDATHAQEDCCILLSPCCASFDQFKNFEERGKVFKEIVYSY